MKLKKLKGIAKNMLQIFSWRNPAHHPNFPKLGYEVEIDLLTGKIAPDTKGDDIEIFYAEVIRYFPELLMKEEIPRGVIDRATIRIGLKETCIIEAKGKTYSSDG